MSHRVVRYKLENSPSTGSARPGHDASSPRTKTTFIEVARSPRTTSRAGMGQPDKKTKRPPRYAHTRLRATGTGSTPVAAWPQRVRAGVAGSRSATPPVELKEKHRIEDAVGTTKAAVESVWSPAGRRPPGGTQSGKSRPQSGPSEGSDTKTKQRGARWGDEWLRAIVPWGEDTRPWDNAVKYSRIQRPEKHYRRRGHMYVVEKLNNRHEGARPGGNWTTARVCTTEARPSITSDANE
jgi:hypothetical protein